MSDLTPYFAGVLEALGRPVAKAFDPDEPRDERGRWAKRPDHGTTMAKGPGGGGQTLPPLPPPRPLQASILLPEGLPHEADVAAFMAQFGAAPGAPTHFTDKAGNLLVIDGKALEDRDGNPKSGKRGHGPFMRVVAKTIQDPDEIWESPGFAPDGKRAEPRLRYVSRWDIAGRTEPVLAVFERTQTGFFIGVSGFQAKSPAYLENQRNMACIYRRP